MDQSDLPEIDDSELIARFVERHVDSADIQIDESENDRIGIIDVPFLPFFNKARVVKATHEEAGKKFVDYTIMLLFGDTAIIALNAVEKEGLLDPEARVQVGDLNYDYFTKGKDEANAFIHGVVKALIQNSESQR